MDDRPLPVRYVKVPLGRRGAAWAIDFGAVALLSVLLSLSPYVQAVLFFIGWIAMRVILVYRNHGQSLGRWALDMRIIDVRLGGTPGLQRLFKREAIIGGAAALALLGLVNLNPSSAWAVLLFLPLGADFSLAFLDPVNRQAFHDQFSDTMMIQTRRGYSLDLKLKRLLVEAKRRVK
jgi:uncharacterized RDD family membrane protein YckC